MRDYLIKVGSKVKSARKAKGMHLSPICSICKLDYSNICRLESGKQDVRISTLKLIADALDVDVKDFL